MTTQFILAALFLLISYGMEPSEISFNKYVITDHYPLPFGQYIITDHYDDRFLGRPVEIALDCINSFDNKSTCKLSPVVILPSFNEMQKKIMLISEETLINEGKIVMESKGTAFTLILIVYECGKPHQLVWTEVNNGAHKVVFTKRDFNDMSELNAFLEKKLENCLDPLNILKTENKKDQKQNIAWYDSLLNNSLAQPVAWTLFPKIEHMRGYFDDKGEEVEMIGTMFPTLLGEEKWTYEEIENKLLGNLFK